MKLITFQSIDAVKDLFKKGYLECNIKPSLKYETTYNWVVEKMNKYIDNKNNVNYPLWCWVKCYNGICPPKVKGEKIFDVKITFNKNEKDVFITDFRRYSFLLNNMYIPRNKKEKELFEKKLEKYNITKEQLQAYIRKDKYNDVRMDKEFIEVCNKIRNSFDRCITNDSDILQGCVWRINIDEIEKIEILKDDGYTYGSLNYIRANEKRFDWIKDYYKKLK